MTRAAAAVALAACLVSPTRAADAVLVHREAHLMGTRATLGVYAAQRASGLSILDRALAVLEATEAELSTWRPGSALSRLNRTPVGQPWGADGPLCRLLADLYEWHAVTEGVFDPAVGALAFAWGIHANGRIPTEEELRTARQRTGLEHIAFDPVGCTVTRRADVVLDAGGFGKGEALDRAAAVLGPAPWLIDLGGQVMAGGPRPDGRAWLVDVAHPLQRHFPYLQVALAGGSLSTSGSSERDQTVGASRVGHILDPRTGRPAPFAGSVTVWHERGLAADILSTALYVMGPDTGLHWAQVRGLSVCYLIPEDHGAVRTAMTEEFARLLGR